MTLQELLALAIDIIDAERVVVVDSYQERDGKIRSSDGRQLMKRYDSFLVPARETLARIETQQKQVRDLKALRASQRKPPRRVER